MCTLHQLQDWSLLKSSLFTQFSVCASEGWALPLLEIWQHHINGSVKTQASASRQSVWALLPDVL